MNYSNTWYKTMHLNCQNECELYEFVWCWGSVCDTAENWPLHQSSFEEEGPSDERNVSSAECQTQRLTSMLEQTLLGNLNMDADGGGARPVLCFYHNRPFIGNNPSVCFPKYIFRTQATCLKFTLMQLHVQDGESNSSKWNTEDWQEEEPEHTSFKPDFSYFIWYNNSTL